MISITLEDLISSLDVIKEISNKNLKAHVAFKLARIMREIEKEYTLFQKNRQELINKYGEKDDNGNLILDEEKNYHIVQKNISIFNQEIQDLLNSEIELNVNFILLEEIEEENFTPQQMIALMPFIKE